MTAYIIFYVILTGILIFTEIDICSRVSKKITFVYLFIYSAIRFDVGYDFKTYFEIITGNSLVAQIQFQRMEFLNKLIIKTSRIFENPQLFFIINALIVVYLFYNIINRFSNNFASSILIFVSFPLFYITSFGEVRQFTAISIVFFGIRYIENNKKWHYLGCILIAMLFHKSAIIALISYLLNKINLGKLHYIILIFLGSFSSRLLYILVDIFLPSNYLSYLQRGVGVGGNKVKVLLIILGIVFIVFEKRITKFYLNNYYIGLFIFMAVSKYGSVGQRGAQYFLVYLILIIPEIMQSFKQKKTIFLINYVSCSILFFLTLIMGTMNENKDPNLPYRIFFLTDQTEFKKDKR